MAELHLEQILPVLLFFVFPLLGGIIASYLRVSPLLGYVFGGIFLGYIAPQFFHIENISVISQIGLVLLLFTIGLEVKINYLKRLGKSLLLLGLSQISFSFLFFFLLFSLFFQYKLEASLILAAGFCISSTAVVAKILQERAEENSLVGSLSMGVLILQDLALIPLLILASSLGSAGNHPSNILFEIILQLSKALILVFGVYYLGHRVIPKVFDFVAKFPREILNLFTITFVVFVLYLFSFFEVPPLIGAFLAGILLAQTLEHQHIFSEIRPFRDFFAILFFSLLGFNFPLTVFLSVFPKALFFAVLIGLSKMIIIFLISLWLRFHTRTAFSLALNLFQVGEGAFVILSLAKTLPSNIYYSSVGSIIILLLLTPVFIDKKDFFYLKLKKIMRQKFPGFYRFFSLKLDREIPNIDVLKLKNHIIICGYGRVGSYVGRALQLVGESFIAVDSNFHVVEKARKQGVNIIYGDPTNPDVLDYLEVEKAKILINAVPSHVDQEAIIFNAKNINPKIKIFTRVHSEKNMHKLRSLGAEIIIHPEFEAALSMVRRILFMKGLPKEEIKKKMKRLKIEHWL